MGAPNVSNLLIRHLSFLGPSRPPAAIDFQDGLNVICGASETGKSFIVESIDYMFGGKDPPRDIPERAGYDRVRLLIESEEWPPLGLERSIEGGDFSAYEELLLEATPKTERRILRDRHSAARVDTLSHELLERVGLVAKRLRKNRAGDTRSLSFRDVARLSVVTEEEVQRRSSPVISGPHVQSTPEYAAFKLLITGTDDSALVSSRGGSVKREAVSGKLELFDQLIEELRAEIIEEGLEEQELKAQLERLEKNLEEQNAALNEVQTDLTKLMQQRGNVAAEIQSRRARISEIEELTSRFSLLDEHYLTDLKRLEAIQESGSFFVHLVRDACPLCGASPADQHLEEECDGNAEKIVLAADAEMRKIRRLIRELNETVNSLNEESQRLEEEIPSLEVEFSELNQTLGEIVRPSVAAERASYNELVTKRVEVRSSLEKIDRLARLELQRTELEEVEEGNGQKVETHTSITKITLEAFSQMIERILAEWHYPNASRVFFDERKRDLQISRKGER